MKTVKLFTIAALGIAFLAACNKDGASSSPKGITVNAAIGNMTKVAYNGNKSAFEAGDKLSLFAWTGDKTVMPENGYVVPGVVNTLGTDGKWTPVIQMKWADMVTPHYFVAVSPAKSVSSFTADPFTLNPAADKYQENDLLIAVNDAGLKANDNPVELVFDHAMAKLNVNLTFRNQWTEGNPPAAPNTEAKIASVKASVKEKATVNYIKKEVTAIESQVALDLNKVTNASWTSLMIPQQGFRTISITLEGNDEWWGGNGTYVFEATEDIKLVSGKITTVNLILGRDQINLKEGGITLTDWVDGDVINNGEAQLPEIH